MASRLLRSCIALMALAGLSCAAKEDSQAADSDAASGSSSSTSDGSASGTTTAGEAGTSAAGSTGDTTPEAVPAHGIRVSWVEANQAIGVKIGDMGEWVGPEGRSAFLLQNRITLIRAFWRMDADFQPREIRAELTLTYPDGTQEVKVDSKVVDDESFIGDLSKSFFWGLMADEAVPGLEYRVDLYEVEPGHEDDPNPSTGLPRDGSSVLVGFENTDQRLDIVLVPVEYDDGANCQRTPDTSEETMQKFYDYMFMMNPVDTLNVTIHDPIQWNEPLTNFAYLNARLSDLRIEENAPPGTYYYGYIDACTGGIGGAGGQAYDIPSIPPEMGDAYQRVSSGLSTADTSWSADTFVHEVGHSQGRRHVFCNGEEGGPDPTYPIEGGLLGEWGFGVIDFTLRHPTHYKDYMTYCNPAWVSTWGWNKVFPVIKEITTWSTADIAPGEADTAGLLVGMLLPDGGEIWRTVPGRFHPEALDPTTRVEFSVAGQLMTIEDADVHEVPEGGGLRVVAPLPAGFDAMDGITLVHQGERRSVDRTQMRLFHHRTLSQ